MAKKKFVPTTPKRVVKSYMKFYVEKRKFPKDLETLCRYGKFNPEKLKKHFKKTIEIERLSLLHVLSKTNEILEKDDNMPTFSRHEKHLAFLYTMVEQLNSNEAYYKALYSKRKTCLKFWQPLKLKVLDEKFNWLNGATKYKVKGKNIEKPVLKSLLLNHGAMVVLFWLNDNTKEKQDTDAFIEKTTKLLFELTDPTVLYDVIDLVKFISTKVIPNNFKFPFKYGW